MAQFRMKVRRVTEEQLEFTIEADSDVHAHQMMEIPGKLETLMHPPVSRSECISVIECCRTSD